LKINKSFLFFLLSFLLPSAVLAENLFIKSFGHSNFLIRGDGKSIILNPYKSTGCASNLKNAKVSDADFILASSRLADEGYNPSNLLMFVEPGSYKYEEIFLNGVSIPHDRVEGRRFGMATVWTWNQSNLKIVHMTGAAGKINFKNKIILFKPDVLFISIGGGNKTYDGKEASEIIKELQPKIVIPAHYLKPNQKLPDDCKFTNADLFLKNISGFKVKNVGSSFYINYEKVNDKTIYIMN
tara:strand:+ start:65 stop:784 length:720 start_codon:yes stop_codon:yes gene_type:complete